MLVLVLFLITPSKQGVEVVEVLLRQHPRTVDARQHHTPHHQRCQPVKVETLKLRHLSPKLHPNQRRKDHPPRPGLLFLKRLPLPVLKTAVVRQRARLYLSYPIKICVKVRPRPRRLTSCRLLRLRFQMLPSATHLRPRLFTQEERREILAPGSLLDIHLRMMRKMSPWFLSCQRLQAAMHQSQNVSYL